LEWASKILTVINAGDSVVIMEGHEKACCAPILSSLVQIMADPLYRTPEGFTLLFCKEWMNHVSVSISFARSLSDNDGFVL